MIQEEKRLTVSQAAERAAVTPGTVRRWIATNQINATKTGSGTYRLSEQALNRFLTNDKEAV